MHMKINDVFSSKVLAVAVGLASGALAGESSAQQRSDSLRLEEVLVTATKREQSIEEIPLSVSTIGSDAIRTRGLERFEDYLASVPGVQYTPGGTVYTTLISMRGVNDPGAENGLTQAPVAVYLDEVPLTAVQGALNLDYNLFGVEQITVIKGPHSTLYGASSLGGTLKVKTRNPSVTEGRFEAQLGYSSVDGGDDGYTAAFTASTPLVEGKLGAEITAYSIERGGYIDDPSRGEEDINGTETNGGRIAVSWLPSDDLTIDAKLYYQDYESDNIALYSPSAGDLVSRPLNKPQTDGDEVLLGSLEINWNLGFADLVSATSAYDRENFLYRDGEIFGAIYDFDLDSTGELFSQELRLVSNDTGAFEWLVGLYFSSEKYDEVGGLANDFVTFFAQDLVTEVDTYAAFGEVGYAFTDRLSLTAGARVSRYEVDSEITAQTIDFLTFQPIITTNNVDFNETDVSPRVALNYELDSASLYVQASRGFRVGQPNTPIPVPAPNFVDAFDSDYLWNYEVGAKTEWWDGRARLNVAAFYIDWSDIQTTVFDPTGSFTFVTNAGSAEVTGFELEGAVLAMEGLTLEGSFSYTDAEFSDAVASQGIQDGDTLPGVPEYQFNAAVQYDFAVAGQDAFVRADYLFYDEFLAFDPLSIDPTARITNGDYERFNARVGVTIRDVQVAVFGSNLTDERPRMTLTAAFGEDATTIQPRTYGISVNYRPQ
jgi:outer membrane receptor protein involved in Fe transport